MGVIQDNGDSEYGWLLGYDETSFTFALRGKEGPGKLTYLKGKTRYELGKLYHIAAVYDGTTMQLFVNGALDAQGADQSGPIVYPAEAPWMMGAYRDQNEFYGHRGRLYEISLFDLAAKPAWVTHEFHHNAGLAKLPAVKVTDPPAFIVEPYLQFGTQTTMTIM